MRSYGAIADTSHNIGQLPSHAAGLVPLPDSVSFLEYAVRHRDQWSDPICVGMGVSQAAVIFQRQDSRMSPDPSARALYTMAKARHGQDLENVLEGTYSTDAWMVVAQLGLIAEAAWPTNGALNELPDMGACETLSNTLRPHRLDDVNAMKNWLGAIRRPFSCVLPVNEEFEHWTRGRWFGPTPGTILGLHCMCAVGYTPEGVQLINSWGDDWGIDGVATVSWDAMAQYATDCIGPTT